MNNLGHKLFKGFQDVVSSIKPTLKESKFYKDGILTPEEFIEAGDFLTSKCPTWKWCAAKKGLSNKALPPEKQYLKTTVRSYKRAEEYLKNNQTKENIVEGDWVDADFENRPPKEAKKAETIVLDADEKKEEKKVVIASKPITDDDDDDDDFEIKGAPVKKEEKFEIVDEEEKKKPEEKTTVVNTRTYDVTVTYDFYYCVPRMWLMGYNEKGNPLTDAEMKEDVMPEYRNKTCTIEPQTHTGLRNISVHPCRHSLLLKKMIQDFQNSGKKLEVHMSILLFLKFLQSVVPTVQYDFTMDISF